MLVHAESSWRAGGCVARKRLCMAFVLVVDGLEAEM